MSDETLPQPPDPHRAHRRPLPPGTPAHIGRYEVLRVLGGGTFGRVYLGFDPEIERYVAIKTPILPPDSRRAFLKEARVIADLHHENICPVYDVGTLNDLPFIVMRFIPGGTLDDRITSPLTVNEALKFVGQIARGLEAAHARGVIHRDLKPANILYDANSDQLLLTDFGIARWLESATATTGGVKGTPMYMAPEQWGPGGSFGDVSPRTDVYSLGVILSRLLTGAPPFAGNQYELMFHHCTTAARKPSEARSAISPRLDGVCLKALEKRSADRYESAKAFAAAIADYLRPAAVVPPPVVVPPTVLPSPPPAPTPTLTVQRERAGGEEVEFPLPGALKMAFCWIPKGECQLGSPKTEKDRDSDENEETRAQFRTAGFWLGKYTVTQAEWQTLMGTNPSYFCTAGEGAAKVRGLDTSRFPVENVSWDMICQPGGFLEKLNAVGGVERVFGARAAFALPHEDMWEYACRGGLSNARPFYWGSALNGTEANIDGNYPYGTSTKGKYLGRPCPVDFTGEGKYPKHPWGLRHMHGNVWEWCENEYDKTNIHTLRGGSWGSLGLSCRSALRDRSESANLNWNIGFRLCLPGLQ
ncbi:MAG TPA: bifunctional serine/threonine-protein kinase/formylglycine-generating enzyme family protein [Gemmata sp.]